MCPSVCGGVIRGWPRALTARHPITGKTLSGFASNLIYIQLELLDSEGPKRTRIVAESQSLSSPSQVGITRLGWARGRIWVIHEVFCLLLFFFYFLYHLRKSARIIFLFFFLTLSRTLCLLWSLLSYHCLCSLTHSLSLFNWIDSIFLYFLAFFTIFVGLCHSA